MSWQLSNVDLLVKNVDEFPLSAITNSTVFAFPFSTITTPKYEYIGTQPPFVNPEPLIIDLPAVSAKNYLYVLEIDSNYLNTSIEGVIVNSVEYSQNFRINRIELNQYFFLENKLFIYTTISSNLTVEIRLSTDRRIDNINNFISRFDISDASIDTIEIADSLGLAFYPAQNSAAPIENEFLVLSQDVINIYTADYSSIYLDNFITIQGLVSFNISNPTYKTTEFSFIDQAIIASIEEITFDNRIYSKIITPSLIKSNTFLFNSSTKNVICIL